MAPRAKKAAASSAKPARKKKGTPADVRKPIVGVNNMKATPADPAVVVKGLAVLGAYAMVQRSFKPMAWLSKQTRRALFNWREFKRFLRERSIAEVVMTGNKFWLGFGMLIWGVRAYRKVTSRTQQIVLNEALLPGDQIFITQVPKKVPRKQRKAS